LKGRIALDYTMRAIDEMTITVVPAKRLRASRDPYAVSSRLAQSGRTFLVIGAGGYGSRRSPGDVEDFVSAGLKEKKMTDKAAAARLKSDGWRIAETTGFMHLIGPLWERLVSGELEFALITENKHHNRRGLVQGGVLMTFADRTCGITARFVSGKPTLATVQLDTHFVEAGKIGEILISKPQVVRSTRSLIFITTEVTVDKRCIAMASGVFKVLKSE
jgi:acyl-coenzyme A thioesterase PaaI-like protein